MSLLLCQFTKMHHEKDTDTLKLDNQFHKMFFQTQAGKSTALCAFISFCLSYSETGATLHCLVSVCPESNSGCGCCENQEI